MNDQAPLLRTAVCIAEWSTAIDRVRDVATRTGVPIHSALTALEHELYALCQNYALMIGLTDYRPPEDRAVMVRLAHAYCTEHQAEIDELLTERESER